MQHAKTTIYLILLLSPFIAVSLKAQCTLCSKIEAERAEEQAKNPKLPEYFDPNAVQKPNEK